MRHLENLYYSRGSTAARTPLPPPTYAYRPTRNPFDASPANPFANLSLTMPSRSLTSSYTASWEQPTVRRSSSIFGPNPFEASNVRPNQRPQPPPEPTPRRSHTTNATAARSLEGDDRPILGGGRGRGRATTTNVAATIEEQEPEPSTTVPNLQRRGTFVLDEPSLPDLPQSGAQRPRDTVNVQELYNVRPRNRAQTPVAFTINLNGTSQPSPTQTARDGTN